MRDKSLKVAMLLRRLLDAVYDVKKAIQGQKETQTEATEAKKNKQSIPPEIHVVNLPQGVEIRKRADDAKDDKTYQSRTLLVAWLTLAAIVIYAVISGWQLYEMRKATWAATSAATTARDSLVLDQRAWVSIKSVTLTAPYSKSTEGQATVQLINSGKTPALDAGITNAGVGTEGEPQLQPVPTNKMVIAPGSDRDTLFINIPQLPQTAQIRLRFVLEYRDIFENDPTRKTTFCGYFPSTQPPYFFNCPDEPATMN